MIGESNEVEIELHVHGVQMNTLLDTGSMISTLSETEYMFVCL
jgi:hypothetical protein